MQPGTGRAASCPTRARAGLAGKGGQGYAGDWVKGRRWGAPCNPVGDTLTPLDLLSKLDPSLCCSVPSEKKLCPCLYSPALPSLRKEILEQELGGEEGEREVGKGERLCEWDSRGEKAWCRQGRKPVQAEQEATQAGEKAGCRQGRKLGAGR